VGSDLRQLEFPEDLLEIFWIWYRRGAVGLPQALGRLGRALTAERRRRLGIRQLQDLDDRLLADTCVSGEIEFRRVSAVTVS
jgi:hypothetical protein